MKKMDFQDFQEVSCCHDHVRHEHYMKLRETTILRQENGTADIEFQIVINDSNNSHFLDVRTLESRGKKLKITIEEVDV